MDPFELERHEKWWAFLQTDEGKKLKEKQLDLPYVEMSIGERMRFDAWALDVLDRMSRDTRGDKK